MNADNLVNNAQRKNRRSGIAFICLFIISTLFPIVASVMNRSNDLLEIAGFFDVAIALPCFILFAALYIFNAKRVDEKVISRTKKIIEYICVIPLILIALYLSGITINWAVLLIGLGWRFWLLIMAVPYIITAFRRTG